MTRSEEMDYQKEERMAKGERHRRGVNGVCAISPGQTHLELFTESVAVLLSRG